MFEPLTKRSAGLDVHKVAMVGTVLLEHEDGGIKQEILELGTSKYLIWLHGQP